MEEDLLIQISNKIRAFRKERGMTLQELADKAKVSKGLISQIENSRTIPSLLVLIDIVLALEVDLNYFFKGIGSNINGPMILVKRKEEYEAFEKESAEGFLYQRIFTKTFKNTTVDIVLLDLSKDAQRPMVETEAFEFKYIIRGKIEYIFPDRTIELNKGDAMLFDGRISHNPRTISDENALMLIVYFFDSN
ncbi:helix-turn-helix domain-containing protein [Solitalea canadensis]|uniref:Putative transcriptional regulator n=1 Tax=Solitalea canadensis (strain ATCC 29591 / DSM 3403 / JCM 21819 / LMG 8368 / NBRC 15130 / NCIMB 12057 / USAM 9D) TaxID=929556 RepID=H8KPX0_SOLCM|nr:XRE family transcriptional regulator [Solitalea canadensis]AFD06079.1 putative transcriptional regulator [Solitalea canadensis DSM 3403]